MAYKQDTGLLVGVFTFAEIEVEKHLGPLNELKEKTGLTHTYAEFSLENCVPKGLKIYLVAECDRRDAVGNAKPARAMERQKTKDEDSDDEEAEDMKKA